MVSVSTSVLYKYYQLTLTDIYATYKLEGREYYMMDGGSSIGTKYNKNNEKDV